MRGNGSVPNVIRLTIDFNPSSGALNVSGPMANKMLAYGILDMAKDAVRAYDPLAVKPANTRNPKSGAAAVDSARVASMLGKAHRKAEPPPVPAYKPPATPAPTRCQWPLTDGRPRLFCEADVERGSYCAKHGALAYTPPSEWAKRQYGG